MKSLGCFLVFAVAACADPSGSNSLGIESFELHEAASGLTIKGIDDQGAVVGQATLRVGRFTLAEDGREVDGRRLDIAVRGETINHESEGYYVLQLPMLPEAGYAPINAFLREPQVAAALITWGVGVNPDDHLDATAAAPAGVERPSSGDNCSHSGCSTSSTVSCSEDWLLYNVPAGWCGDYVNEVRCCSNGNFAFRRCLNTGCGPLGGSGCTVCWQDTWSSYCDTWNGAPSYAGSCNDGEEEYDNYNTIQYSYD